MIPPPLAGSRYRSRCRLSPASVRHGDDDAQVRERRGTTRLRPPSARASLIEAVTGPPVRFYWVHPGWAQIKSAAEMCCSSEGSR